MRKCLSCGKELRGRSQKKYCSNLCARHGRTSKYTKKLLEPIVKRNISMAGVLVELGLKYAGGNYSYIKKIIVENNISTAHFLGKGINKGKEFRNKRKSPEEYLVNYPTNRTVNTHGIKNRIIRDGIKKEICEKCGRKTWMGKKIPLSLHHIDGNRWNNVLDNLQLLCYNCHGQTDNYSGKGIKDN